MTDKADRRLDAIGRLARGHGPQAAVAPTARGAAARPADEGASAPEVLDATEVRLITLGRAGMRRLTALEEALVRRSRMFLARRRLLLASSIVVGVVSLALFAWQRSREGLSRDALATIGSLENTDDYVAGWISARRERLAGINLGVAYNTRGIRIYEAARERASSSPDTSVRRDVMRALHWFELSHQSDDRNALPLWNMACMQSLLARSEDGMRSLREMSRRVDADDAHRYRVRVCTDSDLCPMVARPEFVEYLASFKCESLTRSCPGLALR